MDFIHSTWDKKCIINKIIRCPCASLTNQLNLTFKKFVTFTYINMIKSWLDMNLDC